MLEIEEVPKPTGPSGGNPANLQYSTGRGAGKHLRPSQILTSVAECRSSALAFRHVQSFGRCLLSVWGEMPPIGVHWRRSPSTAGPGEGPVRGLSTTQAGSTADHEAPVGSADERRIPHSASGRGDRAGAGRRHCLRSFSAGGARRLAVRRCPPRRRVGRSVSDAVRQGIGRRAAFGSRLPGRCAAPPGLRKSRRRRGRVRGEWPSPGPRQRPPRALRRGRPGRSLRLAELARAREESGRFRSGRLLSGQRDSLSADGRPSGRRATAAGGLGVFVLAMGGPAAGGRRSGVRPRSFAADGAGGRRLAVWRPDANGRGDSRRLHQERALARAGNLRNARGDSRIVALGPGTAGRPFRQRDEPAYDRRRRRLRAPHRWQSAGDSRGRDDFPLFAGAFDHAAALADELPGAGRHGDSAVESDRSL